MILKQLCQQSVDFFAFDVCVGRVLFQNFKENTWLNDWMKGENILLRLQTKCNEETF